MNGADEYPFCKSSKRQSTVRDLYRYDANFMDLASRANRSADLVISHLVQNIEITSVADFGCAGGPWLAAWRRHGVRDAVGMDGPYVRGEDLEIPQETFKPMDLAQPIDLGRRFSIVQSLEVAEHLPFGSGPTFVETLVRHADIVLFSASPPGQGGENHLNEQPYEYWRDLFAERRYVMIDWLRPRILSDTSVQYWYRYNCFLFVAESALGTVPVDWQEGRIHTGAPVPDVAPAIFRLRKQIVRMLPRPVQNSLSRLMSAARSAKTL